jgi:threonine dehydrogenase-like Zn-dependent dehydrogenase
VQAIDSLRIYGTPVPVGEGACVELQPSPTLIRRHLTLAGSWYSGMSQGRQVMELFRHGQLNPRALVTQRGPLSEFPRLFATMCEFGESVIKALILN